MQMAKKLFGRLLYSVVIPTGLIVFSIYVFNYLGNIPILFATVMAFAVGFFMVYLAFKYWIDTETNHDTPEQQQARFMILFVATVAINAEMVYLMTTYTQVDLLTAQTVASVIIAYTSYYAYRSLVFRASPAQKTVAQELASQIGQAVSADTRPIEAPERF